MRQKFQMALSVVFPPRCVGCGGMVDTDFGLCGTCWGKTPFIAGLVCDSCGVPMPGVSDGSPVQCDECMKTPRPWTAGRSAMLYQDRGRQMVLALKHGSRIEIARAAARWLASTGQPLFRPEMVIAPVPLHWTRLFRRTFNQSAALASGLAEETGYAYCPDLLTRPRRTVSLDHKPVKERFETLENAIAINPKRADLISGKPVLIVDDVMTSGATLAAATEACRAAGSGDIFVLTLARVAKDA